MIFTVIKTSDWDFGEQVEVNTVEDLKAIADRFGEELIVNFNDYVYASPVIEVYDDYRE